MPRPCGRGSLERQLTQAGELDLPLNSAGEPEERPERLQLDGFVRKLPPCTARQQDSRKIAARFRRREPDLLRARVAFDRRGHGLALGSPPKPPRHLLQIRTEGTVPSRKVQESGSGTPVFPRLQRGRVAGRFVVEAFQQRTAFEPSESAARGSEAELGEMIRQRFGRAPAVEQFENLERQRRCPHALSGHVVFKNKLSAGPVTDQVRRAAVEHGCAGFLGSSHRQPRNAREAQEHQSIDLRAHDIEVENNLFAHLELKELPLDFLALAGSPFLQRGKFLPSLVDFPPDPFSRHDSSDSWDRHIAPPYERVAVVLSCPPPTSKKPPPR